MKISSRGQAFSIENHFGRRSMSHLLDVSTHYCGNVVTPRHAFNILDLVRWCYILKIVHVVTLACVVYRGLQLHWMLLWWNVPYLCLLSLASIFLARPHASVINFLPWYFVVFWSYSVATEAYYLATRGGSRIYTSCRFFMYGIALLFASRLKE